MPTNVIDQGLDWIHNCMEDSRGKIFTYNLLKDIQTGAINANLCVRFLSLVCNELKNSATSSNPLVDSQTEYATQVLNQHDFILQGPTLNCHFAEFCRLSRARDVIDPLHFNPSAIGGWPRNRDMTQAFSVLTTSPQYSAMIKKNSYLRGRKEINWLAPYESVDEHLNKYRSDGEKVTRARDLLGLDHHSQDEILLLQVIPGSVINSQTLHKPTTFDAGPNLLFKTTLDPSRPGKTIDLSTLDEGVDEAVTGSILFSDSIKLSLIGRVQNRGFIQWDHLCMSINVSKKELDDIKDILQKVA